ncbi:MAG: shikimate dehydrogenase [Dehalococcoidia bacterium]
MKRAGVIGYPLGHSLSPAIFQAAFDAMGVEARYEAWPTPHDELEARVASLRSDDVLGANVTIPHKEAIVPFLDRLDERAERVGAVNTVANEGGQLVGYNTDVPGFARGLRDDAGFDPMRKRVAVIGAGGAARAVTLALIEGAASVVVLAARTPRRADRVVVDMRKLTSTGITVTWAHWGDGTFMIEFPRADLLVNTTPVGTAGSDTEGQSPIDEQYIPANGVVFDLVYNPPETPLLRAAKARGAKPVSGLGMLVYQAAEALRLWTGQDAPVDAMLAAGRSALGAEATK